jgi:hypothetical protein
MRHSLQIARQVDSYAEQLYLVNRSSEQTDLQIIKVNGAPVNNSTNQSSLASKVTLLPSTLHRRVSRLMTCTQSPGRIHFCGCC